MHFKLIVALVDDSKTELVSHAARIAGATGTTVIKNASGEGMEQNKTFLGLTLTSQRDVLLLLVEKNLCRHILETIQDVGEFNKERGAGIAFQVDVEDIVGVNHQIQELVKTVEPKL